MLSELLVLCQETLTKNWRWWLMQILIFFVLLVSVFPKIISEEQPQMDNICEACDVIFEELLSYKIPITAVNKNHHCGSAHCVSLDCFCSLYDGCS